MRKLLLLTTARAAPLARVSSCSRRYEGNVRYIPRSRCERPITEFRVVPSLAANLRGGKPLGFETLKLGVRDRSPKTSRKVAHFSHA